MEDLKNAYEAETIERTETALNPLEEKWSEKYQVAIESRRRKWHNLSVYFKHLLDIRRVIYTKKCHGCHPSPVSKIDFNQRRVSH
tara:strand:+ start:167 stop:421 length:255 start_codon:yes stop_codon:yes gene_type:complete